MDGDCAPFGMVCEKGHGALWKWLFKVIRYEIPQKTLPMAFTLKCFLIFLFVEKAGKGEGNGVMQGSSLPIPLDFRNVK